MTTSQTKAAQPEGRSLGGELRQQLKALLDGGQAHATFEQAVKDMPAELQGVVPKGLPSAAWEVLEHIHSGPARHPRLQPQRRRQLSRAQVARRLLAQGSRATGHPRVAEERRADSRRQKGLREADGFSRRSEPYQAVRLGKGQNLLREALLIADHEAYHVGELVLLRRLLGAWKSSSPSASCHSEACSHKPIRRHSIQRVRSEPEPATDRPRAHTLRRQHIHIRIPDHHDIRRQGGITASTCSSKTPQPRAISVSNPSGSGFFVVNEFPP